MSIIGHKSLFTMKAKYKILFLKDGASVMLQTFGNRLLQLRQNKKLSRIALADIIGCSDRTIQRYENNEQPPDTYILVRLATYFNVSTDYLLGLDNVDLSKKFTKPNDKRDVFINFLTSKLKDIDKNETYYWIFSRVDESGHEQYGGQTVFDRFVDSECTKEYRVLREVIPEKVYDLCNELNVKPIIINNEQDIILFLLFGGEAIIKKSLCEKHLPHYMRPYVVTSGIK